MSFVLWARLVGNNGIAKSTFYPGPACLYGRANHLVCICICICILFYAWFVLETYLYFQISKKVCIYWSTASSHSWLWWWASLALWERKPSYKPLPFTADCTRHTQCVVFLKKYHKSARLINWQTLSVALYWKCFVNIARAQNYPGITILNSLFCLFVFLSFCLFVFLSFCLFVFYLAPHVKYP